jgi:hypothetical protein
MNEIYPILSETWTRKTDTVGQLKAFVTTTGQTNTAFFVHVRYEGTELRRERCCSL